MSRKSSSEFPGLFDRSATPKSPPELDARILDYARRNTPESTRAGYPLLLKGAATLTVACLGLLVVFRASDPTPLENQTPAARVADQEHAGSPVDSPARQELAMQPPMAGTAQQPVVGESHSAHAQSFGAASGRPAASAEHSYTQQAPTPEPGAMQRRRALSAPLAAIPDTDSTEKSRPLSELAAASSLEQATLHDALSDEDKHLKTLAKHAQTGAISGELRKLARHIIRLHADGKLDEAEQAYRELRERCTQCQLPDSLARALDNASAN